jgi:hypothetical protein
MGVVGGEGELVGKTRSLLNFSTRQRMPALPWEDYRLRRPGTHWKDKDGKEKETLVHSEGEL